MTRPRRRAPAPDAGPVDPGITSRSWKQPLRAPAAGHGVRRRPGPGLGPAGLRPDLRRPAGIVDALRAEESGPPRHLHLPARPARAGGPRARRAVHRPQLHLPARPAPVPARGRAHPRRVRADGHREAEMDGDQRHLRAQRHGGRRRRRRCGATTARAPSPTWWPRTGGPGRSSARSPGWTTGWPSATPRAVPACGAWPSTPRTRRPAPGRRWSGSSPSATWRAAAPTSTCR